MNLVAIAVASALLAQQADVWTFFFAELGVPFRPIAVSAPR
jgi:hypothetical protein